MHLIISRPIKVCISQLGRVNSCKRRHQNGVLFQIRNTLWSNNSGNCMTFESRQQKHDEGLTITTTLRRCLGSFSSPVPPSLFVLLFTATIVELLRSLAPAMHTANGGGSVSPNGKRETISITTGFYCTATFWITPSSQRLRDNHSSNLSGKYSFSLLVPWSSGSSSTTRC